MVYEDDQTLAFTDIRPVSAGHTLVIPKLHYVDIYDIPEDVVALVFRVTKRIASAVKAASNADGITVVQQNGKAAGQDIFHIHVHVIPRFEGMRHPRMSELTVVDRATLDEVAAKIRNYLH